MHAVITGSTGMVGGSVLRRLLEDDRITKVTSLSRRSTGLSDPKLTEVLEVDFGNAESLSQHMVGVDILFHCIATYAHTVDRDTYEKITVSYLQNVLTALQSASPSAHVSLFSASGAAQSEKSWYKALNTKGRAEKVLLASEFPKKMAYRPGMIIPTRTENHKGFGDTLGKIAYRIMPFIGTTADELANVVVETALSGLPDGSILGPADIARLDKEYRSKP